MWLGRAEAREKGEGERGQAQGGRKGREGGGDHRVSINYLKKILDFMSNMKHDC